MEDSLLNRSNNPEAALVVICGLSIILMLDQISYLVNFMHLLI